MNFQQATTEAPKDADFIAYQTISAWVIVQRLSNGVFSTTANTDGTGYSLIASGISARGQSLYSAEAGQFICGTVEQLVRFDKEA